MTYWGELAALGTACCWTVTSMSFESAGRRVGSLAVNLIRLVMAAIVLSLFGLITRGMALPTDAGGHAWLWLGISGLAGFCIGDLCLFRAFVLLGSRLAMLVYSLTPLMTALIGWAFLGEQLSLIHWLAMALTISGVAWVVMERVPRRNRPAAAAGRAVSASGAAVAGGAAHAGGAARASGAAVAGGAAVVGGAAHTGGAARASGAARAGGAAHTGGATHTGGAVVAGRGVPVTGHDLLKGVFLALGGCLGQSVGLVMSKYGMGSYDAFAATQIRVLAGTAGFVVIFFFIRWWPKVFAALGHGAAMTRIGLGAFFGPFLGVSLSLLAVQHTATGVAATIMSVVPVLIIVPSIVILKDRVTWRAFLGALVAVGGVALLFLH
jgi:drug/metabolite transporter (DMT)-like permease